MLRRRRSPRRLQAALAEPQSQHRRLEHAGSLAGPLHLSRHRVRQEVQSGSRRMSKITAITFQKTGHVLGVVTRTSQPDQKANVQQVAEGGFLLSRFDTGLSITIPAAEL